MHQVMTDTENYQSDKNNNFSLKASTYIIMSITALPIKLTEILVIMSVSIFKTAVILYLLSHYMKQFIKYPSITCYFSGVMVNMLASSEEDCGFDPVTGHTKDYEIGIYCF